MGGIMTAKSGSEFTEKRAQNGGEFEAAASRSGAGLVSEFWYLLKNNKKYWLLPILLTLLIFSGLMLLSSTAVGPLIYTFF
jgi:hypothetical protein